MSNKTTEVLFGTRVDGSSGSGEFGTSQDLVAAQRYLKAHVNDFLTQLPDAYADHTNALFATGLSSALQNPDQAVRSIGHGGWPMASLTTRTITNRAGVIAQKGTGALSGLAPVVLIHRLDADELSTQLTAGDATNPRIDSLFIKIDEENADAQTRNYKDAVTLVPASQSFYKQRRTRLVKSLVVGTPHATDPVPPAVPVGYARYCDIYVPAAWNAVIDPLNIRDHRVPQRITFRRYGAKQWSSTTWTVNSDLMLASAAGGNIARLELECDNPHMTRLLAWGMAIRTNATGLNLRLQRYNMQPPFSSAVPVRETVLENLDATYGGATMDAMLSRDAGQIGTGKAPVWMTGYAAGGAMYESSLTFTAAGLSGVAGLYLGAASNADKVLSTWVVTAGP